MSEQDTGGYFAYKVPQGPRETWSSTDSGGEMEVTGVTVVTKLKGHAYKRSFDLVILILAHIVLLPVWLLLWTLIPDSRGTGAHLHDQSAGAAFWPGEIAPRNRHGTTRRQPGTPRGARCEPRTSAGPSPLPQRAPGPSLAAVTTSVSRVNHGHATFTGPVRFWHR